LNSNESEKKEVNEDSEDNEEEVDDNKIKTKKN